MTEVRICEYCGREIHGKGYRFVRVQKGLEQEPHHFCQWHCYMLYRFQVPGVNPESIYHPSVGILVEWSHGRIRSEWEQDQKEA